MNIEYFVSEEFIALVITIRSFNNFTHINFTQIKFTQINLKRTLSYSVNIVFFQSRDLLF